MKDKEGSLRNDYYVSYKENLLPDDDWKYYIGTIFIVLLHPLYIDGSQVLKCGLVKFFQDSDLYTDFLHVVIGYYCCYLQVFVGPEKTTSLLFLIFYIILCLVKTFFYMKIF